MVTPALFVARAVFIISNIPMNTIVTQTYSNLNKKSDRTKSIKYKKP